MATQRGYYRSELLRALNNIAMALTHLARLVEAYSVDHPEIAEQLTQACEGLSMVAEVVLKIHDSI